jgi:hypothetical protein
MRNNRSPSIVDIRTARIERDRRRSAARSRALMNTAAFDPANHILLTMPAEIELPELIQLLVKSGVDNDAIAHIYNEWHRLSGTTVKGTAHHGT